MNRNPVGEEGEFGTGTRQGEDGGENRGTHRVEKAEIKGNPSYLPWDGLEQNSDLSPLYPGLISPSPSGPRDKGDVEKQQVRPGAPGCQLSGWWRGPAVPVGVEEGIKTQPIAPAAGEVSDVHVGVAGCLPLAPDQQSFPGRQQGCTGPILFLVGQGSMVTMEDMCVCVRWGTAETVGCGEVG
jgi:hypothetical protein